MATTTGSLKLDSYLKRQAYKKAFRKLFLIGVSDVAKRRSDAFEVTGDEHGLVVTLQDLAVHLAYAFDEMLCDITITGNTVAKSLRCNCGEFQDDEEPRVMQQTIHGYNNLNFEAFFTNVIINALEAQLSD